MCKMNQSDRAWVTEFPVAFGKFVVAVITKQIAVLRQSCISNMSTFHELGKTPFFLHCDHAFL